MGRAAPSTNAAAATCWSIGPDTRQTQDWTTEGEQQQVLSTVQPCGCVERGGVHAKHVYRGNTQWQWEAQTTQSKQITTLNQHTTAGSVGTHIYTQALTVSNTHTTQPYNYSNCLRLTTCLQHENRNDLRDREKIQTYPSSAGHLVTPHSN